MIFCLSGFVSSIVHVKILNISTGDNRSHIRFNGTTDIFLIEPFFFSITYGLDITLLLFDIYARTSQIDRWKFELLLPLLLLRLDDEFRESRARGGKSK